MIKLEYECKNYNYGNVGKQGYDIKTNINMVDDAGLDDLVEAFIKLLKIATYHISRENLKDAIDDYFDENGE